MQRFFDIILSSLALLVFLPLMLVIMTLLYFSGEGEVFYKQERIGRKGEVFWLLKFATMLKNSLNIGSGTITIKDDPRVLPLGTFLRKTKINELPQLFNILRGDMSVIGPRPQAQSCFDAYTSTVQKTIIKTRPGLSGIGSIIFRDEEIMLHGQSNPRKFYDEVIAPYKGKLEEWYVANQTLTIYFALIGLTIWVVLFSRSLLVWRIFPDLPPMPKDLQK
jgi:lipopolysaccharide/colanic/teichoic acid biosynthesis glycosyltransferase